VGDNFEKHDVIRWDKFLPLWIVGIHGCQDEIMAMEVIIHKIFGKELMVLSAVALENFESTIPELKELLVPHPRISIAGGPISKKSLPVEVLVPSVQVIGCGVVCS
jgi:hypothetical protein